MDKLTEEYGRLQCHSPRERNSPSGRRFDFSPSQLQHTTRRRDFSSGSPTGKYSGSPKDTNSPRERKDSWGKSVRGVMDSVKVSMSYVMPVSFSMTCHALLQEHADQRTFGLVVVCQKDNEPGDIHTAFTHGTKVGSTIHPKYIKPGESLMHSQKTSEKYILRGLTCLMSVVT